MENSFVKEKKESTLVVHMSGRLDSMNAAEFSRDILASLADVSTVILDFAELIYISSAGLRALLQIKKQMNQQNGEVIVKNLSDEITEVFTMTGFDQILKVE